MYSNFIADKESSEKYGIICVKFGTSSGDETVSGGSETELSIEKTPRSNDFHITSQRYVNPISFNMQIVNKDSSSITEIQERMLNKWLCKMGKFYEFKIDDIRFKNIIFNVNISNPQIIKVGDVVGMEFKVTCKSPFGYTPLITKQFNITSVNQQIDLFINNDEDNYIYPDIKIIANTSGNLSITNSTEVNNRVFTINNLSSGEIITIRGKIPTITSSLSNHAIWTDFNLNWIRIKDGKNTLTISNLCSITLSFNEPRKVGI